MNTNLLHETLAVLEEYGKTVNDVKWVGGKDFRITWENFEQIADTEYYAGFGASEVATDLVVVGEDWWLERYEYDGSEWWEFKSFPKMPDEIREITAITVGKKFAGWKTLASLNSGGTDE